MDDVKHVKIPKGFLDKIIIGPCKLNATSYGTKPCVRHKAMVTDFNVWDRALSEDELVNWTNCR